jgi:hypothetical protein
MELTAFGYLHFHVLAQDVCYAQGKGFVPT